MGDMADFALDQAFEEEAEYIRYLNREYSDADAYDRGIINENGGVIGNPYGGPFRGSYNVKAAQVEYAKAHNPSGPGLCPKCGGKTHLVKKRFYGCDNFPSCRGSRNL